MYRDRRPASLAVHVTTSCQGLYSLTVICLGSPFSFMLESGQPVVPTATLPLYTSTLNCTITFGLSSLPPAVSFLLLLASVRCTLSSLPPALAFLHLLVLFLFALPWLDALALLCCCPSLFLSCATFVSSRTFLPMTFVCRFENETLVYFDWEVSRGESSSGI